MRMQASTQTRPISSRCSALSPGAGDSSTSSTSLISPLRDRWTVEIEGGPDLDIKGNIVDHEYTFTDGRTPVATVSKQWFRVADTYGVEVEPSQDPVVVLAATVALDMMAHEDR